MSDIIRRRKGFVAGGMTSPTGLDDPIRRYVSEMQQQIEELARRPNVTSETISSTGGSDFDDSELQRKVSALQVKAKSLQSQIDALDFAEVRTGVVYDTANDYVLCYPYVESTGTINLNTTFYAAKPQALRVTPFNGLSVTYENGITLSYAYDNESQRVVTRSSDGATWTENIYPPYGVDATEYEVIRCIKIPTDVAIPGGNDAAWMDMNFAGRTWSLVYSGIVTVSASKAYVWIDGSPVLFSHFS